MRITQHKIKGQVVFRVHPIEASSWASRALRNVHQALNWCRRLGVKLVRLALADVRIDSSTCKKGPRQRRCRERNFFPRSSPLRYHRGGDSWGDLPKSRPAAPRISGSTAQAAVGTDGWPASAPDPAPRTSAPPDPLEPPALSSSWCQPQRPPWMARPNPLSADLDQLVDPGQTLWAAGRGLQRRRLCPIRRREEMRARLPATCRQVSI